MDVNGLRPHRIFPLPPRSAKPSEGEEVFIYTSNQFCAFCRMTRSVYTLCGFEKLKPVGFCVLCAFCGNYTQRNYK